MLVYRQLCDCDLFYILDFYWKGPVIHVWRLIGADSKNVWGSAEQRSKGEKTAPGHSCQWKCIFFIFNFQWKYWLLCKLISLLHEIVYEFVSLYVSKKNPVNKTKPLLWLDARRRLVTLWTNVIRHCLCSSATKHFMLQFPGTVNTNFWTMCQRWVLIQSILMNLKQYMCLRSGRMPSPLQWGNTRGVFGDQCRFCTCTAVKKWSKQNEQTSRIGKETEYYILMILCKMPHHFRNMETDVQ